MESHSSPPPGNWSADDTWKVILHGVQGHVSDQTFRTWFEPLCPITLDGGTLTVEVPNPFFLDWLEEHHRELIGEIVEGRLAQELAVVFTVSSTYADRPRPLEPMVGSSTSANGHAPTNGSHIVVDRRPLPDSPVNPLTPRFTFANFVVGNANQFCRAACEAVSQAPGRQYNPLFIHGGVGLGKTHIMQAIGHEIITLQPHRRVRYVSSEQFMNEMIQSIQRGTTFDFKRTYRSADVLLIDDIQFLAGKESTQEEFFHTFNTLHGEQKQIVITSDRPPRELRDVEERLVSRFSWGLVTDMNPPDYETRVAILRRKAEQEEVSFPDSVIELIARSIDTNVRELEGCLVRMIAFSSLTGRPVDTDVAEEFLKVLITQRQSARVTISDIQRAVARRYEMTVETMKSRRRTSSIAFPRQVAMYLAKQLTGAPLAEIGREFGKRDHTTVLYAVGKIDERRRQDRELAGAIDELTGELQEPRRRGR